MNSFVGMGRLGKDPEIKRTQSDVAVCQFSLAINRRFKNKQTNDYDTDWLNCVAFRQTAEFISRFFRKGNMIGVVGTVQTRKWDDQDGKTHYATEIIVEQAHFCGSKQDSISRPPWPGDEPQPAVPVDATGAAAPANDTALPFDI